MIKLNDLYKSFESEYGTYVNGFFRIQSDFVPTVNSASIRAFNYLASQYPKSQQIADMLLPFERSLNVSIKKADNTEIAPYPPDYKYFKAAGYISIDNKCYCEEGKDLLKENEIIAFADLQEDFFPTTVSYERKGIELITTNKWSAVLNHPTRKPKEGNPKIRQLSKGFEIKPEGMGVIVLDYYRMPIAATYDYTVLSEGVDKIIQYKESSIALEWGTEMIPVFIYLLGKTYGLNIRNELISQLVRMDKTLENI